MESETKFCEDCRFFQARHEPYENDYCLKPRAITGRDLVRRSPPSLRICDVERSVDGGDYCGLAGKWFEPKSDPLTVDDRVNLPEMEVPEHHQAMLDALSAADMAADGPL